MFSKHRRELIGALEYYKGQTSLTETLQAFRQWVEEETGGIYSVAEDVSKDEQEAILSFENLSTQVKAASLPF